MAILTRDVIFCHSVPAIKMNEIGVGGGGGGGACSCTIHVLDGHQIQF